MMSETVNMPMNKERTEPATVYGLLAEFSDAGAIVQSAEQVRKAGYTRWDVHTPFPVHGLDEAMGIRPTILPWIVLGAGLSGLVAGLGLQWWTNAVDYPLLISGKPIFSLPANIPVIFEVTVLLSAVTTVFALFGLNGLPRLYHPVFTNQRFRRATADRFFIVIEANDPLFDAEKTQSLLSSLGATAVEVVED
ncbi:MAG: DUF3341 domain-containing protein [Candidatus Omnitrophota bacterium]|jgi:hypothetical protein|nr:MAG: DUF3341 domain-containing protein [Candidatus Omnitrophota bacterium]